MRSQTPIAEIGADVVRVRTLSFDPLDDRELARAYIVLSEDERERAERMAPGKPRHAFALTRAALRREVAAALAIAPRDVRFALGRYGKPHVTQATALRCNVAHSGTRAIVALAVGCELGVDLERRRELPDLASLARRALGISDLSHGDVLERERTFFRGWVRKEAYAKALGTGLSLPLDSFHVSSEAGRARIVKGAVGDVASWTIEDLEIDPAYEAALAYDGPPRNLDIEMLAE